jgi:hypothetical protein
MEYKNLNSSRIKKVGYIDSEATLIVVFKNNSTYEYLSVPKSIYINLVNSRSAGKFFEQNIKGKYLFEKV